MLLPFRGLEKCLPRPSATAPITHHGQEELRPASELRGSVRAGPYSGALGLDLARQDAPFGCVACTGVASNSCGGVNRALQLFEGTFSVLANASFRLYRHRFLRVMHWCSRTAELNCSQEPAFSSGAQGRDYAQQHVQSTFRQTSSNSLDAVAPAAEKLRSRTRS